MTPTAVAYGELLKEKTPHAIRTRREHRSALREIEALMVRDELAPAEVKYLDLLATLVQAYEREHVKLPQATPLDILHELMAARDMKQADLAKLVGSSGTASEIYRGKRAISKALAHKLGEHFAVSYALFV